MGILMLDGLRYQREIFEGKQKGRSREQPLELIGGVEGDRTPDLMNAIHALSQLSYDPKLSRPIKRILNLSKSVPSVKPLGEPTLIPNRP